MVQVWSQKKKKQKRGCGVSQRPQRGHGGEEGGDILLCWLWPWGTCGICTWNQSGHRTRRIPCHFPYSLCTASRWTRLSRTRLAGWAVSPLRASSSLWLPCRKGESPGRTDVGWTDQIARGKKRRDNHYAGASG